MEEKKVVLAIAEQLLDDSDESDKDIDSELEEEYVEDELFLSLMIQQRKNTLRELLHPGRSVARNSSYSSEVARVMDDPTFKTYFGMTRDTFQVVCEHLRSRVTEKYVDLNTQLMVTLWMLGTHDSYRNTAEQFRLSKSTVHFIVMRLCKELASMSDTFISWPASQQKASLAAKFEETARFPGVVGCVGHTCIKIKEPSNADVDGSISPHVLVQGVCDASMKFIFVRMWHQGCVENKHQNSELVQLTEGLGDRYHILGDLSYPLSKNLLTPYKNSEHLLEWQGKYNDCHHQTHSLIEYTFAQLKVRLWRLNNLDMTLKSKAMDVILACCVLHNIIVEHEGPMEMTYNEVKDVLGNDSHDLPMDHPPHPRHGHPGAASKREQIACKLY